LIAWAADPNAAQSIAWTEHEISAVRMRGNGLVSVSVKMKNLPEVDDPPSSRTDGGYDLKYVPARLDEKEGGGWYRELPGDQLEVMSHARMECVPLESSDPEDAARAVVEKIMKKVLPS
jgi:hypothetical protein